MRTPLSLSYTLILSLTLSSCSSGFGDRKKLGRQSSATSSGGSSASGADMTDPATQAAEKTRLVAEGKKSVENLGNLKAQLEDLQKKLDQPDADLKKPQELLTSLSLIIADIEKGAASLKNVAESYKAVSEGKAPGKTAGLLGLTDSASDQSLVDAQIMLRRVTRLAAAADEYFLKGKEDCKNDPTPTFSGFSAASFYRVNFEHCRGVNRGSPESVAAAATLGLRELGVLEIIGIIVRSLITLVMRIMTALVLGFLYGDDGSQLLLNPLLGQVMHHNKTKAIFWGTSWKNDTSDIIPGIDHFLSAWGNSHPASLANEYYDIHGPITAKSEYLGHVIIDTPTKRPADWVKPLFDIMAEVCKLTNNDPDKDTIYMVYTDTDNGEFPVGAIHYPGLCGRKPFQITWMPKVIQTSGVYEDTSGHSPMLSHLANASAHEIWETMANPLGDGWYTLVDLGEVGDRCYTTFPPTEGQLTTLSDGSKWRLQSLWSNAAFKAKSGIGEKKACIY